MNKERAIEILTAYRPGQGLESDPEVRQALDLCARDPEIQAAQEEDQAFDKAFSEHLRAIEVPSDLQSAILRKFEQKQMAAPASMDERGAGKLLQWFHPVAFGVAATIIALLALSFTYWQRPVATDAQPLVIDNPLMNTADNLYANLKPSFVSRNDGQQILNYLKESAASVPASLPKGFAWDRSFACDVMEVDGHMVSVICFKSPDQSNTLHLFTFKKSDFPHCSREFAEPPKVSQSKKGACATWASDDSIHVLYSDEGEEKLRQLLEI